MGDLKGKFMIPGIISTHEHPLIVMALQTGLNLEYTQDAKRMLERAYTLDAAYMNRWENIIGSLEVGKRADMIVLDRNLFDIIFDEIAEVNVLATMMNDEVVHEEAVDWDPPRELWDDVHLVP